MMFSIGAEQDGTTALDIANAGVVTASYVNLVIAPDGCTIPTGGGSTKSVPAGYSFAFDGNVLGDATNVSLSVQFDPTIINATLDLQGFDLLGVVSMNTTTINLAMDSSNSSFSLGFSGGFGIGDPSIAGRVINVNGDVISTSPGNFTLVLGGGGNVNLVDVIDAGGGFGQQLPVLDGGAAATAQQLSRRNSTTQRAGSERGYLRESLVRAARHKSQR